MLNNSSIIVFELANAKNTEKIDFDPVYISTKKKVIIKNTSDQFLVQNHCTLKKTTFRCRSINKSLCRNCLTSFLSESNLKFRQDFCLKHASCEKVLPGEKN